MQGEMSILHERVGRGILAWPIRPRRTAPSRDFMVRQSVLNAALEEMGSYLGLTDYIRRRTRWDRRLYLPPSFERAVKEEFHKLCALYEVN